MAQRVLLFLILIPAFFGASAQDFSLAAMLIPDTLLQNADAVIRFHHTEINRLSAGKAVMKVHFATTVLNKNGRTEAWLALYYDNNRSIKSLSGKFYNALGLEIDKVKKEDITDFASYPDFTFYSDSRVKLVKPIRKQYPYTAEFEYEIVINGLVGFDMWMPVSGPGLALEQADLTVLFGEEIPVSYKTRNGDFDFVEQQDGTKKSYRWSLQTLPAYKTEPFLPPKRDFLPWIMLSPVSFEYARTRGNFENWQQYGVWVNELITGREEIPKDTRTKILDLIKEDSNAKSSIRTIYQYMQRNTRYVNISMGIGGFQPMKAGDVDKNGYGDCKALSNYTKALLKVAGIESFYAEIGNGKERGELFPGFPSINQTNHVILCVPLENDTIWLECTNQQIPCGYIGNGNTNRKAVLVSDKGGQLVNTPRYSEADNLSVTTAYAIIGDDGDLTCDVRFSYHGLSCARIFYPMNISAKEQNDWLLENLQPDQVFIKSYDFSDTIIESYQNSLAVSITTPRYATSVGKRLMIAPNIFNKYTSAITKRPTRVNDIYVDHGYSEIDSLKIALPEAYRLEYMPEHCVGSCMLGSYEISFDTIQGSLTMNRKLVIKGGTFSKDHYDEISGFFKTIDDGDRQKGVMIKR